MPSGFDSSPVGDISKLNVFPPLGTPVDGNMDSNGLPKDGGPPSLESNLGEEGISPPKLLAKLGKILLASSLLPPDC